MNWTPELIAAIAQGIVAILGGIAVLIVAIKTGKLADAKTRQIDRTK